MWVFTLLDEAEENVLILTIGVGCQATDLDVSPAAFDKLAARASGRVDVTWAWLSPQATA